MTGEMPMKPFLLVGGLVAINFLWFHGDIILLFIYIYILVGGLVAIWIIFPEILGIYNHPN